MKYTVEMDKQTKAVFDSAGLMGSIKNVVEEAIAQQVRQEAEQNLQVHRSAETGTAEKRSEREKDKRAQYGEPLADSMIVYRDRDEYGDEHTYVGPRSDVAFIGYFLEYGYENVFWGNKPVEAAGQTEPKPWLRPAFDSVLGSAATIGARETREKMAPLLRKETE